MVAIFLSRKIFSLTISYNFLPSSKYLIQQLMLEPKSRFQFSIRQLLIDKFLQVTSIVLWSIIEL